MGKGKRRFLQVIITLSLLAVGVVGMNWMTARRQKLVRRKPPAPVPVVRVTEIKTEQHQIVIQGEGTVRPLYEIRLVPQVGGKVTYVSPTLVNGGAFSKGDLLIRINPVDYELALTLAEAKVKNGESNVQIAEEESAAAKEEWRLNHPEGKKQNLDPPPLVGKEPQLAAVRAMLAAYHADVKKARLNLQRTKLKAPFNGRVAEENIGIGQYVLPGQSLATLYAVEAAEIVVPMEDGDAFWFNIPGFTPGTGAGAHATVTVQLAGRKVSWRGRVVRTEGKLDQRTRLLPVVIRVERPYSKKPPLAIGLFVTVHIQGRTLPGSAFIPRSALHQGNTVWIVGRDDRLRFRKVKIARFQAGMVLVSNGLKNGDQLVISPIETVTDGMTVRPLKEKEQELS